MAEFADILRPIAQRDPGRIALRRAARVAIAVPVAVLLVQSIPALAKVAVFATFATLALLVFSDFGGPLPKRALAYLVTTAVGIPIVIVGSYVQASVWISVVFMALVTMVIGMLGVLRGFVASAQPVLLLATVLAVTTGTRSEASAATGSWVIGGLVATAAAVLLWPAKPGLLVTQGLATVLKAAADTVDARWGVRPGAEFAQTKESLNEAVKQIHGSYDGNLQRPAGVNPADRSLAELVDEVSRLRFFPGWADQPDSTHSPALQAPTREFAAVVSDALRKTADRLLTKQGELPTSDLSQARTEHFEAMAHWVAQHRGADDAAEVRRTIDEIFPLRLTSVTTELAMQSTGVLTGATPTHVVSLPDDHRSVLTQLRAHMSWDSPWFRNALRSAVALSLSVLLAKVTGLEHSFWIVLGTLSALRFDALGTGRSAWQAFVGTTGGVIVSVALIELVGDNTAVWWMLTPVALFFAAYTSGTFSLAIAQAGFSVAVIVMFSLLAGATLQTAEFRIVEVTLGLCVSLFVSALMWPRGVVATLRRRMADAIQASGDFFVAAADWLAGGAVNSRIYQGLAQTSNAAIERAQEAFDLSIAQKPPKTVPLYQWVRVSNVARQVDFAARLFPVIDEIVTTQGDQRVIPAEVVGPMMDAVNGVRDRLSAGVAAWSSDSGLSDSPDSAAQIFIEGSEAPPLADEVVAFRAAIDRYLDAPDDWQGLGDDPRAITLIWIADWTALLDWGAWRLQKFPHRSVVEVR